jgi:glycerophosphoryl diester phosphodiesterase
MSGKPDISRPIAHRGLHDSGKGRPENSRSAFEAAIAAGYAIECDLQLSGDDVPMVMHDPTLDRTTQQSGELREISAGQISRIPFAHSQHGDTPMRFSELLLLVNGQIPLAVELKHHGGDGDNDLLARKAAGAVKGYAGSLVFISFVPDLIRGVRNAGFSGPTGIIVDPLDSADAKRLLGPLRRFWLRHMLHYPWTRFDLIASSQHALTLPLIRLFRWIGFPVMTWTITSEKQARAAAPHTDAIAFEGFEPARD